MRTKAEQREYNVQKTMNCCVHFQGFQQGFQHDICKAGVNFIALNSGSHFDLLHNLPCWKDSWNATVECERKQYPSRAEAEASEARLEQDIRAYTKKVFTDHLCPRCDRKWEGKQVGPCVYCEHCGHRLYQGTKP